MQKNNLVSLLDTTFPNANRLFRSPARADGREKWVDFVAEFWHCECIRECSEKAFMTKYQRWCKKNGYNFSEEKALKRADDAQLLHLVDDAGSSGVAELQAALEHGYRCLLGVENYVNGLRQKLVIIGLIIRSGHELAALAAGGFVLGGFPMR